MLEKGQVGLLEGNGAEAVVPLDQNKKWISAVAEDMESAQGNDKTVALLEKILEQLSAISELIPDGAELNVDGRTFARLVKAVK